VRVLLIALPLLAGLVLLPADALAAPTAKRTAPVTGIGIRLADAPATLPGDSSRRSYIVNRVAPGATIRRRVEIENGTGSRANVAVYAAAADLNRGTFSFARSHVQNELSSWTSVGRQMLRLEAGADAYETVTIAVPRDASAGERYAVIWAQVSAPARAGGGVTLVNRVGVRMYLSVGSGGLAAADFAIGPLHAERSAAGGLLVVASVNDSGGRTLDIGGQLTLTHGPGGLRAGPFPVTLRPDLAPGASESVDVRLDRHLPLGPWRAHLSLTSGFIHRDAVATIKFPALAAAAKPSSSRYLLVAVGILLALLLAVAAGAAVRRGRLTTAPPLT
jgi:hypothetical protein